ncbi:DUF1127 domain-containing protein [bacterium]|nr:DUF1127 domain-containing protein [bacterium]
MTCIAANFSTPSHGGGVFAFLSRATARMAEAADRRRTLRQLRSLDGATLRDIGMSRAEIAAVVYGAANGRRSHG